MIQYIKGNLFDASTDALAHGCNTKGKMHQGIANQFRQHFPDMFQDYKRRCEFGDFQLGQGYMYSTTEKPAIINLATQAKEKSRIQDIDKSLAWLAESYTELGIKSVAMPRIGCGLGRLEWEVVHPLFQKHFENSDLKVEIWNF